MQFKNRKLPKASAEDLRRCPIDSFAPYALVSAPTYFFMKRNEKFIGIKAPLDFFTEEELEKLKSFHSFYQPQFVDTTLPYRDAARSIRLLLTWEPKSKKAGKSQKSMYPEVTLPIAPFELSDAVVRTLAPLLNSNGSIEPFFISVMIEALCEPLPKELLIKYRESNIELLEKAILQSSCATFLSLLIGYCNLPWLCQYRERAFEYFLGHSDSELTQANTTDEIILIVEELFKDETIQLLTPELFETRSERASQKIDSRYKRMLRTLVKKDQSAPSIFGPEGFSEL